MIRAPSSQPLSEGLTVLRNAEIRSDYCPQPADVFACWSPDPLSMLISLQTSSIRGPVRYSPSHVAIASPWSSDSDVCWWFESTTLAPRHCMAAERRVSGMQVHSVADRLNDYTSRGGTVEVYRLVDISTLDEAQVIRLRRMLCSWLGSTGRDPIGYDAAEALLSGTRFVHRLSFWRKNLDKLFCSEVLAAVLQELGRMNRRNPADFHPGRLIRELVWQGPYRRLITFGPGKWMINS